MLALYLDLALDEDELVDVQLAVGEPVDLRRIPWLLPASQTDSPNQIIDPNTLLPHLRRLQMEDFSGQRVLFVAPRDLRWYAAVAEAIRTLVGTYPLLVQTPASRDAAACPGPLRIVDMEAYYSDGDSSSPPPWLSKDSWFPPDTLE